MFSEELGCSASKKRAEEIRARRRRLKQQQEQNKKKNAAKTSTTLSGGAAVAVPQNASSSTVTKPCPPVVSSSTNQLRQQQNQLSAVERAEQQRKIRAQAAQLNKSAVKVQSFIRSALSNIQLRRHQEQLLRQRLDDLNTLRTLLAKKQSQKKAYIPPPATTAVLTRQLLVIASSIPYVRKRNDSQKAVNKRSFTATATSTELLAKLLEYCILPALNEPTSRDDPNVNALLVWMDSCHGRLRLDGLLRLSVLAIVSPASHNHDPHNALTFLRCMLVGGGLPSSYGRSLLLMKQAPPNTTRYRAPSHSKTKEKKVQSYQFPFSVQGTPLDFIAICRYYLLFVVSSQPIPNNANELRERCISESNKERAGSLVMLALQAVVEAPSSPFELHLLNVRVLVDILTIPLLTWKVSNVSYLVTKTKQSNVIPILNMIQSLVELHSSTLAAGEVGTLLAADDVPLTLSPATPSQCLLANLVQLCQLCPHTNGSNVGQLDYTGTSQLLDVMSTLLDAVPVGTFSSRDSSVEWISDGKGHHTPIVLSHVILEQCKWLLLDSLVRRLFRCALQPQLLGIADQALSAKNDKDRKNEKDLMDSVGGGSTSASTAAADLAAKEARVDRNKSFWNSSKWARKLTKSVTTLLSGTGQGAVAPSSSRANNGSHGALLNTSSMSRILATGKEETSQRTLTSEDKTVVQKDVEFNREVSLNLFIALCRTYSIILARWGGGGQEDIVHRAPRAKTEQYGDVATAKPEACTVSLLNTLCFSTSVVRASWGVIQSDSSVTSDIYSIIDPDEGSCPVRALTIRPSYAKSIKRHSVVRDGDGTVLLYMLVCTLAHQLIVTDDVEIHDMDRGPLPIHQIRRCIQVLKKLLYRACCIDDCSLGSIPSNYGGLALISASSRTMRDLYDRSSRRPLCAPGLWLVSDLLEKDIRQCKTHGDYVSLLSLPVLRVCPFLVSFKRRLKIFERIVTTNKIEVQGVNEANPFNTNPLRPGIPIRITRGRLLEDGLATMNNLGSNMRQRIAVQYVNEAGAQETGVDAGGLFKEFWSDLSAIAFNVNYALFQVTDGAGACLYPNPSSSAAHGPDHIVLFAFLGRILGKALYEGITIHPRFAHFFLSFLRGDYNFLHMLPDLSTVDPQLYNNLMFLKTYDGDASDLSLTFTVTSDELGGTKEIELLPDGANVEVCNANKHRYIGLVAKYYVVDRVKEQSEAFTHGLWEVIDRSWLRLFNEPELQVLISGSSGDSIDVADWRANTRYVGGYTGLDRTVSRFWNVVTSLDRKEKSELLRFVTSCERPPPLGFASMNPPFTIQRAAGDSGALPSASTCFNTLKLPNSYGNEKILKQRLLYAIQSGAGFELT